MSEKTYFQDGIVTGDAQESPYSAEKFSEVMNIISGSYVTEGLVVTAAAGRTVDVSSGSAFIRGVSYYSDGVVNLSCSENTTSYGRLDYVVLRVNRTNQTCRLTVVEGKPSAVPSFPTLHQNIKTVYDFPLVLIYQPSAFVATNDIYIYDQTIRYNFGYSYKNIMPNSEFIGMVNFEEYYGLGGDPTSSWFYPALWVNAAANFPNITLKPKYDFMDRGNVLHVESVLGSDTMQIDIPGALGVYEVPYTIKIPIQVYEFYLDITFAGEQKRIYPFNGLLHLLIRISTDDATNRLTLDGNNYAYYDIGQIVLNIGEVSAPYGVCHEYIPIYKRLTLPAGDDYVDLDYTIDNTMPSFKDIDTVFAGLYVTDTASAGTSPCYCELTNADGNVTYVRAEVGLLTNSTPRHMMGFVHLEPGAHPLAKRLYYNRVAAGTMTAYANIVGIMV